MVIYFRGMQNWWDKVYRGTILRCFVSQWSPLKWLCEQTVHDKTARYWSALTYQVRYIVELPFQSILFLVVACPLSPLTKYESQLPANIWGIEYRWPWTKIRNVLKCQKGGMVIWYQWRTISGCFSITENAAGVYMGTKQNGGIWVCLYIGQAYFGFPPMPHQSNCYWH